MNIECHILILAFHMIILNMSFQGINHLFLLTLQLFDLIVLRNKSNLLDLMRLFKLFLEKIS